MTSELTRRSEVGALATAQQESALEVVYFGLFDNCNVKCNMCDCWERPRSRTDTDYYMQVLDNVLALSPRSIRFTGGEPLLMRGLPELIRRAADQRVRVSIITNGRLLEHRLPKLVDAGLNEVVLSLDATAVAHDQVRGVKGLFERVLRGWAAVEDCESLDYGLNTVLQRKTIDHLSELASIVLDRRRPPGWWHLIPVRGNSELDPTAVQKELLKSELQALRRSCKEVGTTLVASANMFDERHATGCGVPKFTSYIRADTGEVYGCNMLAYTDTSVGNVTSDSAEAVWGSKPAQSVRSAASAGDLEECARCDLGSREMNHVLRALGTSHAAKYLEL